MADNSISIICATCEKAMPGDPNNRILLGKTWGSGYEVRFYGKPGDTLNLKLDAFFQYHNTCAMGNELCFELRYEGPHSRK